MSEYGNADIFTDVSIAENPYPYYEYLRQKGQVVGLPGHDVIATLGYEETLSVLRDDERFSAVTAINGPFPPLPFTPEGDDITAQIEDYRNSMPFGGLVATQDTPHHTRTRSLLGGILTPKRLRENEAFMNRLAAVQLDGLIDRGRFEVATDFGKPFTARVIADLLGIPEEDHQAVADLAGQNIVVPGTIGAAPAAVNPLEAIGMKLFMYLAERRATPTGDVLSDLAQARYSDGTLPELPDVVGMATFLFAAGLDTAVHLFTAALRLLAENQELQAQLRADHSLIPNFLEEVLRLHGAVKANFRLSKVPGKVGDVDLAPGTHVFMALAAANRDARRFERPDELLVDRKNSKEHLSFGRGIHACPGAPLARIEGKVALERILDRFANFRLDEEYHGPEGARTFDYIPTYMFQGLKSLHLTFTPA